MTQDRRIKNRPAGKPPTPDWDAPAGAEQAASPSAAPAAGQAGLAKLVRYHHNEHSKNMHDDPCGEFYKVDDVEALFATLAAPVAADTEQASKDAEDLIAAATQLREVPHWAAQASVSLLAEIAGRMLKAAPLATPADAGAGDEHPHKADAAELSIAQVVERLRRDAAGGLACNVFELDRAADLLESLARLSTSGAPAPEGTVTLCQYSSFGPWIECDPSDEKAVKFAPVRQSPAPVTAEPVAEFADDFIFCLRKQPNGERWPVGTKLYTHPAPADRDAIRAEALEEAIVAHKRTRNWQAVDTVRALKSMERAADAAETRDAKGDAA